MNFASITFPLFGGARSVVLKLAIDGADKASGLETVSDSAMTFSEGIINAVRAKMKQKDLKKALMITETDGLCNGNVDGFAIALSSAKRHMILQSDR